MSRIVLDARKLADFGIGTYVRGLAGGLAELDAEHEIVLLGDPASAVALPEPARRFAWIDERSPGYSLRELWRVPRAVRRAGAALYHAPHYVLPLGLSCPAVVTVHDLVHLRFAEHRRGLKRLYAPWMIRRALRRSAATLAVSETTRRELLERFGGIANRVETIPNGIDDRFRTPPSDEETSRTLGALGLVPGFLLFVGNPKPHKNLDRLLAAHARRHGSDPELPTLVIAGGRPADDRESPGVRFLGRVGEGDLPALYRGALALVVPSLWEGFGLPALEGASLGTPVVAARAGALPEVLGEAALYVDPESVDALAAALERIVADAGLRRELAARGPERAAGYSWRRTAAATLAVYRRVLEPRSRAR